MPEVTSIEDVDGLYRLSVLDTLGHEFAVYFTESKSDGYQIATIRLPEGTEWDVDMFQEMIGVRDEAVEYFESNDYEVPDAGFDLDQVTAYDSDPHADA